MNVLALLLALSAAPPPSSEVATASTANADANAAFDRLLDGSPRRSRPAPRAGLPTIDRVPLESTGLVVEAIEILGNETTARRVILSRLRVSIGEQVNDARLEESRLRLLNSGFFKSVEFSLRRGSRRGRVLLIVEVVERNTILIDELYLGFSSVSPFFGGFGLVERNFLGRGVTAGGGFVIGEKRRALELRLFVPDLSGTPIQLSGSTIVLAGAEVLDERRPEGLQLEYRRIGGRLGAGFNVGPSQRISMSYRLESISAGRLPNLAPAILRAAPSIQFGESILSTLAISYERDTRNDGFVPTRGGRVALDVELGTSLVGSDYEFSKYEVELQQAFSPIAGHSLILVGQGGLIQGNTPFFNQFFIGDYAYFVAGRDALPRNLELNFSESNDYDDLLVSVGALYAVPVQSSPSLLFRTFVYGGINLAATASLDELQEDLGGRGFSDELPLSFDLGLKFDTWIGDFTLSLSYMLNLVF